MDTNKLANKIAFDIFKIGDEPFALTSRIAFMGVNRNTRETETETEDEIEMGGLGLLSLTAVIESSIKDFIK